MIERLHPSNLQPDDAERIHELFAQLSQRKPQDVESLLKSESDRLFLAVYRKDGKILGMASMNTYRVVSGYKGWIEDVVVDKEARGLGVGRQLIEFLISQGKSIELTDIFLFTEEEKQAAIHLYEKLGFKQRDSRLYNLKLI